MKITLLDRDPPESLAIEKLHYRFDLASKDITRFKALRSFAELDIHPKIAMRPAHPIGIPHASTPASNIQNENHQPSR